MDARTGLKPYDIEVGYYADATVDLVAVYLERFERAATCRAYGRDLADFFGLERVTLEDVRKATPLHVNEYIAHLQENDYKSSTIKRRVAAIRGFFEWLVALDVISKNPSHRQLLRRVRSSGSRDKKLIFLTSQQAERLVEAADGSGEAAARDRALLLTLLHCVLRRSEAAAMNVDHIRPLGHYWVLDLPNTKSGTDQYVKIPAHVVERIEEMKTSYGIEDGPLWRSVSNNSRGNRLSARSIYGIVDKVARRAGLPAEIGAHSLRHTGCTLAIEAGASIHQVQVHARHKNIETTMMYVHQRDRLRDSAADYIHLVKD